ncbi:hypothetical protein TGRUB_226385 [Toxoplasma gondii RUB]|uniref:Uncharacterized protein n=8 Tax=Toxoplasma gondii TaxID=5811 RepID=A0A125YZL2_TOXGV|nr:hypothetical protein TGGT1_226385 [Toxoplasma gondii GT1]ESS32647.1 hypothetical protein TGVEG_226385 [Toxoplasma gondii VEG]KFG42657.1 hypothetical protein TGP89_226385 [Toxoplasma gondii p89]KFG51761.1 hypothetical protein TGFOU_226385 [Toxoplasma gondii FOU]KFG60898.1 hypothetical protein TGRUB_226385 [Toxoplasma gondii RUB]KFH13117.1 hypothetical protein TGVAND_226385 [Toxoplasma gondii VAND]PUA91147.1 hypothetical protein TGBR9_226385 [Toxoplasma gondii TgCATBr9]RQX74501.1 hypothetic
MKNILVNGCTSNKQSHVQIAADSWFSFLRQDLGRRKLTNVTGESLSRSRTSPGDPIFTWRGLPVPGISTASRNIPACLTSEFHSPLFGHN